MSRVKKLSRVFIAHERNFDINFGRAASERNFDVTIMRAACEACSARWNLGKNSAFSLESRKIFRM
jgi:hypothetical protein